jgi:threonine dehydrogenase-like Zn-dependent dehydrogenase
MHLEKAIRSGAARVYVSELSPVRLGKVADTYAAIAREHDVELVIIDLRSERPDEVIPDESVDDVILAAPVAQAATGSLRKLSKGAFANLFAGIPKDRAAISLDLHWMHYYDITLIATSGSTIANFKEALNDASQGVIDPNNVIAAVGGMDAIREAFQAVLQGTYPGKVVIYPQIEHLLTGVTNWTIEDERALLGG